MPLPIGEILNKPGKCDRGFTPILTSFTYPPPRQLWSPNGQSKGDYHDNFDSATFIKWMCVVLRMYPVFCQELQHKVDNGTLNNDHGFYDWAHQRPTRELIISADNAPYHHGVSIQLGSMSKEQIRCALLKADITTIAYYAKTGLATEASCHTPFPKSAPSAPALEEATFEALFKVNPQIVIPPYRKLMEGPAVKEGAEAGPG